MKQECSLKVGLDHMNEHVLSPLQLIVFVKQSILLSIPFLYIKNALTLVLCSFGLNLPLDAKE